MGRLQPILTQSEEALVEQVATLTHTKRTDVLKNAITVYAWYIRQLVTGGRVVARKATGEEVELETSEIVALEARGQILSPKELGTLARKLAGAKDEREAAQLKERLARGFYGI